MKPHDVPLADLMFDPALQSRESGLDDDHADDLRAALDAGDVLPPVEAFRLEDGRLVVVDGFHTGEAYRRAGRETIRAFIHEGDWNDALIAAAGSNIQHTALKRTNADKRKAVRLALTAHPEWSDRKLAAAACVGADLVGDVRRQLSESGSCNGTNVGRTGKDGRVRKPPVKKEPDPPTEPEPSEPDVSSDDPPDGEDDAEFKEPVWLTKSPDVVAGEVKALFKRLRDVQLTISHLRNSPYKSLVDAAGRGDPRLVWSWDGKDNVESRHFKAASVHLLTHSCPTLDTLRDYLSSLFSLLEKQARVPADVKAPWEG